MANAMNELVKAIDLRNGDLYQETGAEPVKIRTMTKNAVVQINGMSGSGYVERTLGLGAVVTLLARRSF